MKKFNSTIMLIVLSIIPMAFADTNVYIVNKTPFSINLKSSTKAPSDIYKINATSVGSQKKVKFLTLNRNVGIKEGKTYLYQTFLSGGGLPKQSIVLTEKIEGKSVGSDAYTGTVQVVDKLDAKTRQKISAEIKSKDLFKAAASFSRALMTPDNKPQFIKEGEKITRFGKKIGDKMFTVEGIWDYEAGDIYQDIIYTISSSGIITPPNEINLLQYNIQQRPFYSTVKTGSIDSARLTQYKMPDAINTFDPNIDVVTINEAFAKSIRPKLIENMRKNGFLYFTQVLGLKASKTFGWSGGVMIFSKYPIIKTKEYIYKNSSDDDKDAAKGVLYVQINKKGKKYNIFATHTNASYTFTGKSRLPMNDEGRIARRKQFVELKQFINEQRIPNNQPVIIVGDLNVDQISEQNKPNSEYSYMLKTLQAAHPTQGWHPYSLDKKSNEYVDPNDGPQQRLDYGLYSKAHQKPSKSSNNIICLKVSGKNVCQKRGKAQEISDHYPLQVKMKFD